MKIQIAARTGSTKGSTSTGRPRAAQFKILDLCLRFRVKGSGYKVQGLRG